MKLIRAIMIAFALSVPVSVATSAQNTNKKPSTTPAKTISKENVRTLDVIRIHGEIAVPQVLFITSREYRRFRDGLGLKFRLNARQVAASLDVPTRLRVVAKQKADQEEEK